MHYDAGSLFYRLHYSAEYEEQTTVNNATFEPQSQQLPILYCVETPMGKKP